MNSDFLLGNNAILSVEPEFREGRVVVYFRVMRGSDTIQMVRFIDPDLAMKISDAFYTSAELVKEDKE